MPRTRSGYTSSQSSTSEQDNVPATTMMPAAQASIVATTTPVMDKLKVTGDRGSNWADWKDLMLLRKEGLHECIRSELTEDAAVDENHPDSQRDEVGFLVQFLSGLTSHFFFENHLRGLSVNWCTITCCNNVIVLSRVFDGYGLIEERNETQLVGTRYRTLVVYFYYVQCAGHYKRWWGAL